jgi:hypothetical protein
MPDAAHTGTVGVFDKRKKKNIFILFELWDMLIEFYCENRW